MGADLGRADEGHGLDVRVVADQVHRVDAAVDDVEYTLGYTGFQRQFHQAHGHQRVLLGRLEDEGIAGGDGHREHPQRDHRREVERGDAGAHAQRLQQGVGVDAVGHVVGQFAHLQIADAGGVLDHFQAAEHVTFGIRQGLALLGGQQGGQFLDVLADQLLVLEEDTGTGTDRGLAPGLEGLLGAGNGGVHFLGGGEGDAGQDFLGGRVDHVTPLGCARFDEFAVDEKLDAWNAGRGHFQFCLLSLGRVKPLGLDGRAVGFGFRRAGVPAWVQPLSCGKSSSKYSCGPRASPWRRCTSICRSSTRRIFPEMVLGSSLTNSMRRTRL
ncbi:hypothetical protein D3C85_841940 [compost metagenome]